MLTCPRLFWRRRTTRTAARFEAGPAAGEDDAMMQHEEDAERGCAAGSDSLASGAGQHGSPLLRSRSGGRASSPASPDRTGSVGVSVQLAMLACQVRPQQQKQLPREWSASSGGIMAHRQRGRRGSWEARSARRS